MRPHHPYVPMAPTSLTSVEMSRDCVRVFVKRDVIK